MTKLRFAAFLLFTLLAPAENPVHVHDLNATVLHLLGLDHEKLTFKYQGREFRLTDVHGNVQKSLLR